MKVYLDNSTLNRPFDNQAIPTIRLEAIAITFIFAFIEIKTIKLVNSSVIEYENSKNPFFERKIWISAYLAKSSFYQKVNQEIKNRAKVIEKFNLAPIDSLHLASAESVCIDYFITCDYDIIRKYKGKIKVINPVDFIKLIQQN